MVNRMQKCNRDLSVAEKANSANPTNFF